MKVSKERSWTEKVAKKAIQVSFLDELLEWPPKCMLFDYQPKRPNDPSTPASKEE